MARLDGTKLGAATVLALAFNAACGSSGVRATSTGSSGGGHGGATSQGGSTASSTTSTVASTSVVTVGTGGNGFGSGGSGSGGSGGATAGCNPPAAPGSLWELEGLHYPDFTPVSMCQYRGDVTLIVNTAAI